MSMFGRFSLNQLNAMETVSEGHTDDLKLEVGEGNGKTRVWLSRLNVSDGAEYDNQVTVEKFVNGDWINIDTYQATDWSDYEPTHPFVKELN